METAKNNAYFMEDAREKKRLTDKVDSVDWAREYLSDLVSADTTLCLDVGCGPGVIAAAVAREFPQVTVTGLERSQDRFSEAAKNLDGQKNADAVQGDATQMPFADATFDLVYTRFMLEYLKDRVGAIAEMVRVCRPGGKVMLQDLDGQLLWHYPISPELTDKIDCVVRSLKDTGFDPFLGRKLFHMARMAGLQDIHVKCEPYHFYAGRIDDKNHQLWELKLDIALPVVAEALGGEQEAICFKKQFLDHLLSDETLTYSNLFTIVGTKATQ